MLISPRDSANAAERQSSHDTNSNHASERSPSTDHSAPVSDNAASPQNSEKDVEQSPSREKDAVPPLPDDQPPPLPTEAPPSNAEDDGWAPVWDDRAQAYYFYNRFTHATQWENPRVSEATQAPTQATSEDAKTVGGYNPAIHGDYDPTADYAKTTDGAADESEQYGATANATEAYASTGAFNRFTGKWQNADFTPERFSDEAKSKRQMNAFFDVDAAANSHDGRSLKAERANKKISKQELQAFKNKRRDKKEEKRRAWLRD